MGARETECMLSIVLEKLKSRKRVNTYALLDPGSTATFCTEDLQKNLNVRGKIRQILLSSMVQDKPVNPKLMNTFVILKCTG